MFSNSCTHLYPLSTIYIALHEFSDVFFHFAAVRYTFDVKVFKKKSNIYHFEPDIASAILDAN